MQSLQLDDIQGIILRGYGRMTYASFLLLSIEDVPSCRRWLAHLKLRSAASSDADAESCTNVAMSYQALQKLELRDDDKTLAGEFRDGMVGSNHR